MATEGSERRGLQWWTRATLTLLLAVALLACVGVTAYIVLNPAPVDRYTELYLLGASGKAEDYPAALVIGENKTVIACVGNYEGANESYELAVTYNNSTTRKIAYLVPLTLGDNATWEHTFVIAPDIPGDQVKIGFELYRADGGDTIYRECHLWMNVSEPYNYSQATAK